MKKMIIIAVVCLLSTMGWAQDAKGEPKEEPKQDQVMTQDRTGLGDLIDEMPAGTQEQIRKALKEAEACEKQLKDGSGVGTGDGEAVMEQKREQARKMVQEAIQAMDKISDEEKAKCEKAIEKVQDRLQEKKSELEEAIQERAKKQDGTGKVD